MIHYLLIFNAKSKIRFSVFYSPMSFSEQQNVIRFVTNAVIRRSNRSCNFLELEDLPEDLKLVYRHYASLYFTLCIDKNESELSILDFIQSFVEVLNGIFVNVCEVDITFNFAKVDYILQEMIVGGLVVETDVNEVISRVKLLEEQEKKPNEKCN
ncbi:hypothetical protein GJ496_003296 [Pomphorhynchus laevis]|nr:hypothetical protein GJ496_003296 [Pomphorhynchus laevis]